MAKRSEFEIPAGLQELVRQFEEWRSSHSGRRPIPEALWIRAADLWSLDIFWLTEMRSNVSLFTVKHKDVVRRRDKLAANLPPAELLRGSLLQRIVRHKSGCPKCERGEGHPVLVLAVSEPGGKVRHISLRPEQKSMVEGWIENYHHLKEQIEEVCQLNQTLLRPEH